MSKAATNTLYLVRHGENRANITKEFSYKLIDYSLTTPKGEEQARQTATFFKDIPLSAIYTSPLKRARETAEWIAQVHHLPVTSLEEFREVNVGALEIPASSNEILLQNWKEHDRIVKEWISGNQQETFPQGENFLELLARIRQGLLKVSEGRADQHILISSHGGLISALVKNVCQDKDQRIATKTSIGNCSITTIELTREGQQISGLLRSWASIEHLSGDAANLIRARPDDEVLWS